MPKSDAFARIKADVLKIVAAIPSGKLTTYRSIGEHLDVVPRHVAYILTMLSNEEKQAYPWFRVVADEGDLGKPKFAEDGVSQSELLVAEDHVVSRGAVALDSKVFIAAGKLKSGVAKQTRAVEEAATKSMRAK